MKMDCVAFLQQQSTKGSQPRQDYFQFINLSHIMLGEESIVGDDGSVAAVHFSPPCAYHHARWMAKGIYCLKMYLFRAQFKLHST